MKGIEEDHPADVMSRRNCKAMVRELSGGSRTARELASACPDRGRAEKDMEELSAAGIIRFGDGLARPTEAVRALDWIMETAGEDADAEMADYLDGCDAEDLSRRPVPLYAMALAMILGDGPMPIDTAERELDRLGCGELMLQSAPGIASRGCISLRDGILSLTPRGIAVSAMLRSAADILADDTVPIPK